MKEEIEKQKEFHFFHYFFSQEMSSLLMLFCSAIGKVEEHNEGFASEIIKRVSSIKGKTTSSLEAIISIFSEVLIFSRVVNVSDIENGKRFLDVEPGLSDGKKNPELRSRLNNNYYAIEVKTPSLNKHVKNRHHNPIQLPYRMPLSKTLFDGDPRTLPRDNPIKDFLVSASEKFEDYKEKFPDDFRFLFIFWDDFMYEPISALTNGTSGLLTDKTYYKDKEGNGIKFPLIDGVFIIRHIHHFRTGLLEEAYEDGTIHAFDYQNDYLPHVFIQNPYGRNVPRSFIDSFGAATLEETQFMAEYKPIDFIFWL